MAFTLAVLINVRPVTFRYNLVAPQGQPDLRTGSNSN
jgi:hypothetical protein